MEPIIEFNNVNFAYENSEDGPNFSALEDVSLKISPGEFVAVLGHNGSGKSTLAKLTNAILTPDKGNVIVKKMNTNDSNKTIEIRKTVGMVMQNPDNQIVATIVEDDVAFGPENLGVEPAEIRKRVDNALRAVGMLEHAGRESHKLSGGQKQRVAIAGVLAMQTECIVLDEPTAMLDPRGRKEVFESVLRLNETLGITVLYVTHFMDEAVRAKRVLVMNNGKIIASGSPREVFAKKDVIEEAGLDIPQAAKLAGALRERGIEMPKDILTAEECIEAVLSMI